jgi:hypothetical protein
MAGTGKSIISQTVAKSFADEGKLVASFFFKRGKGDRGNASMFFTTVYAQLLVIIPELTPPIEKAIDTNPYISGKSIKEQFEKLIYQPLSEIRHVLPQGCKLVILIDTLDKCEQEEDIRTILCLLSQTKDIESARFQIFVTSRPELPIRLSFMSMLVDTYQDLILHEMPYSMIEHDIATFLKSKLANI